MTVSHGDVGHLLPTFDPASMQRLVRVLASGFATPLLDAADLMWIGAGLARVRDVRIGSRVAVKPRERRFTLFLSHRGRDAKKPLVKAVRALPRHHGVFLDCLTMPHGVVNTYFVFGSLIRSERVLIVKTPSFDASAWCRKEAWLADALARESAAVIEQVGTIRSARARIHRYGTRRQPDRTLYMRPVPVFKHVWEDLGDPGRVPNITSLNAAGHDDTFLEPLTKAFAAPGDVPSAVGIRRRLE